MNTSVKLPLVLSVCLLVTYVSDVMAQQARPQQPTLSRKPIAVATPERVNRPSSIDNAVNKDLQMEVIALPASAVAGTWVNTDAKTNSITRLQVHHSGTTVRVRAWGKCTPKDCDWGEASGQLKNNAARIIWDQGFAKRVMSMTFNGNELSATTRSKYSDGRPSQNSTASFRRQLQLAAIPSDYLIRGTWQLGTNTAGDVDADEKAKRDFEEAIRLARESGSTVKHVGAILEVANQYLVRKKIPEAKAYFSRAAGVYEKQASLRGVAATMRAAAQICLGHIDDEIRALANNYAETALKASEKLGDTADIAASWHQLGTVALQSFDTKNALRAYTTAYRIRMSLGDQRGAARSLAKTGASYERAAVNREKVWPNMSGPTYINNDAIKRAIGYYEKALQLHRSADDLEGLANSYYDLGAIHLNLDDRETANRYFEQAIDATQKAKGDDAASQLACRAQFPFERSDGLTVMCLHSSVGMASLMSEEFDEDEWLFEPEVVDNPVADSGLDATPEDEGDNPQTPEQ